MLRNILRISQDFSFEASHFLIPYHGKCEKLHGHSYRLRVTIDGELTANGLVLDFAILKRIVRRHVIDRLDHVHLNDVIENPSAERVCMWIWKCLEDLNRLLVDEIGDPNLAEEIKKFLRPEDREGEVVVDSAPVMSVRLYEVQLWETPNSSVVYSGS